MLKHSHNIYRKFYRHGVNTLLKIPNKKYINLLNTFSDNDDTIIYAKDIFDNCLNIS